MNQATLNPPELLAPAGNLESFFAAIEFGADAVYVGLKEFSARAKAKNFSRYELERMVGYAHSHQKKVFLTLNTLVKENELSHLIDVLAAAEAMGLDAIILQDLGVWRLMQRHFPSLEGHASTQMTVHNVSGAIIAEKAGFKRVVLARELSLQEIAFIKENSSIDLEHFVHGAHCFSLSGQCSFSSWLGGLSANRGRCTQPCRRRYNYKGDDGFYFSPNDLSAIDLLPDLTQAGITSFKIEGRMKSSAYVANVVKAYRMAIDSDEFNRPGAIQAAKELLKESFGRRTTQGFLKSNQPADMVHPGKHAATGRLLGKIEKTAHRQMAFTPCDTVSIGDRLRIQPLTNKPGYGLTVRELFHAGKRVQSVVQNTLVTVPVTEDKKPQKGDLVFKVASGESFKIASSECRKRLEQALPGQFMIDLFLYFPGKNQISIEARSQCVNLQKTFEIEFFPAKKRPLSHEALWKVFKKSGGLSFCLGQLICGNLPAVVLPLSRLNDIRRNFYRELHLLCQKTKEIAYSEHRKTALSELSSSSGSKTQSSRLAVAVSHIHEISLLYQNGIDEIIFPLVSGSAAKIAARYRYASKDSDKIIWELPVAIFDSDWEGYQTEIEQLIDLGFQRFRLQNLGQFLFFDNMQTLRLEGGYRLFTTNTQAALFWKEMGLGRATLFIEDDKKNMSAILSRQSSITLAVMAYANFALMTSRIPLPKVKNDRSLVSDMGDHYRVAQVNGMTEIRPTQDFSLFGQLNELRQLGCSTFIVDLSHRGLPAGAYKKIFKAYAHDERLPNTSTFNFEHDMA